MHYSSSGTVCCGGSLVGKRRGGLSARDMVNGPGWGSWSGDLSDGLDRQGAPRHGTVGPAKRGFACDGQCWTPNRFGVCKVCGGTDPLRGGCASG